MRRHLALLALLVLAPFGSAAGDTFAAESDDCVTQLLVVWGPHVEGACAASFSDTVTVSCASECQLAVSAAATGSSAAPTGAGVFAWVAYGEIQDCGYLVATFAQGLPPCASSYAYPCSAVVELAGSVSCSGVATFTLATPPGGCSSFVLGATGHARLRAPPSPSPPPFTVLVPDSAFAMMELSLVRDAEGSARITAGLCA